MTMDFNEIVRDVYGDEARQRIRHAYDFARAAHVNQKRASGEEYFSHPCAVAKILVDLGMDESTVSAAFLHDVVEDTDRTLDDLAAEGFSDEVIEALALLTHDGKDDYMTYVRPIKDNPIAKAVKLADLRHNSDLSRLDVVDEKALTRYERYQQAIAFLTGE